MLTPVARSEIDAALISDEFQHNPYPLMARLQDEAPVYWSESIGAWIVTRYDDVQTTFKVTRQFSNEGRLGKAVDYLPAAERARFGAFEQHYATKSLIHSDPPDHTRLRGLVTKAFTPRVIEGMKPRIQAIIDELLDQALAHSGPVDLIGALAAPLPATVLAEIMGVAQADTQLFKGWADDILSFQGLNRPPVPILERAQRGIVALRAYLTELIAERRRRPGSDFLSQLVAAESEGERLSTAELISTCVTFFIAGHETTLSLVGNGLLALLQHPAQLAQLRADPRLMPSAIEEMLRYESPVPRQPRRVAEPAVLGGQALPTNAIVMQFLHGANRDPRQFPDPHTFDIRRANNRHMAFGFGIHFCVGAPLARVEAPLAVAAVLRRMPQLRLVNARADWDISKPNSRLLHSLWVEH
ncbi:MAG: cytochrome P450 [Anaerolineales bacterium]|nr:cytochrome P450 [Anaerolineales bacterium]